MSSTTTTLIVINIFNGCETESCGGKATNINRLTVYKRRGTVCSAYSEKRTNMQKLGTIISYCKFIYILIFLIR